MHRKKRKCTHFKKMHRIRKFAPEKKDMALCINITALCQQRNAAPQSRFGVVRGAIFYTYLNFASLCRIKMIPRKK